MHFDKSLDWIRENATHLKALGERVVFMDSDQIDPPWSLATGIEPGAGYRLSGPTGLYIVADVEGVRVQWSVDFERRDANGAAVSLFDRDRLRSVAMKLPPHVRDQFADYLKSEVLPGLEGRTKEIRAALNNQLDSEDCVRGLIAFARQVEETV